MILYGIDNIRDLFGHKVRSITLNMHGCLHDAIHFSELSDAHATYCPLAGEPVSGKEESYLPPEPLVYMEQGAANDVLLSCEQHVALLVGGLIMPSPKGISWSCNHLHHIILYFR